MEFDFGSMLEKHRRDRRWAWTLTLLLVIGGAALGFAAWRMAGQDRLLLWSAALIAALAVVPLREALDRADRIAALERLRGAWAQSAGAGGSGTEVERLRRLIRDTHGVANG